MHTMKRMRERKRRSLEVLLSSGFAIRSSELLNIFQVSTLFRYLTILLGDIFGLKRINLLLEAKGYLKIDF